MTLPATLAGAVVFLAAGPARADDFSTGTDNWTEYHPAPGSGGNNNYSMGWNQGDGNPPGCLTVGGDGYATADGFEKTFTGIQQFAVSFDWRAQSTTAADTVTNMSLLIVRVSDGAILYNLPLLQGTLTDSDWRTFPTTNLSFVLGVAAPPTDIKVRFTLNDAWSTNWGQKISLDNFVFTTSPPPPPNVPYTTDDFSASLDGWSFWTDDTGTPPTANYYYQLLQDTTQGNPAASANLWGNYDCPGYTRFTFGMEKTINVVDPFVVTFDRQNAAPLGFQIFDTLGNLRSSMYLPPTAPNTFETYGPVDFSSVVTGLSQVKVRFSQLGLCKATTIGGFWIDNFSYTADCTNAADGLACADDGNPCTDDICQTGQCTHPDNASCFDGGAPDAGADATADDAGPKDAGLTQPDASTAPEAGDDAGSGTFVQHSGCACDLAARAGRRSPAAALGALALGALLLRRRRR